MKERFREKEEVWTDVKQRKEQNCTTIKLLAAEVGS